MSVSKRCGLQGRGFGCGSCRECREKFVTLLIFFSNRPSTTAPALVPAFLAPLSLDGALFLAWLACLAKHSTKSCAYDDGIHLVEFPVLVSCRSTSPQHAQAACARHGLGSLVPRKQDP
jgi:hypothetical protein